jgi:hypothetical protein
MHDNQIPYIVGAALIGYATYHYFFSKKALVKRKFKSIEEKNISDLKDGDIAKIKGTVKYFGKTLKAPLSGRKCAHYYVLVEENRRTGKSSSWYDLIEEEVSGNVIIKNGNDYAIVLTSVVQSYIHQDEHYSSGFLNDATDVLEKFLAKHGHKSVGIFGLNDTIRYKEGVLEEGETIVVAGKVRWIKKTETHLTIPAERILVIGPDNEVPVYLSDDPDIIE